MPIAIARPRAGSHGPGNDSSRPTEALRNVKLEPGINGPYRLNFSGRSYPVDWYQLRCRLVIGGRASLDERRPLAHWGRYTMMDELVYVPWGSDRPGEAEFNAYRLAGFNGISEKPGGRNPKSLTPSDFYRWRNLGPLYLPYARWPGDLAENLKTMHALTMVQVAHRMRSDPKFTYIAFADEGPMMVGSSPRWYGKSNMDVARLQTLWPNRF